MPSSRLNSKARPAQAFGPIWIDSAVLDLLLAAMISAKGSRSIVVVIRSYCSFFTIAMRCTCGRTSISCDFMELLVVGSCTDKKDVQDCPRPVSQADFDDPATLLRREADLRRWAWPAVQLYMGWQHNDMMKGVNAIRDKFGTARCAVRIICRTC